MINSLPILDINVDYATVILYPLNQQNNLIVFLPFLNGVLKQHFKLKLLERLCNFFFFFKLKKKPPTLSAKECSPGNLGRYSPSPVEGNC